MSKHFILKKGKLIYCIVISFFVVVIVSCNTNCKQKLSEHEMSNVMKQYIIIDSVGYVLNITKEEAYELGVDYEFYDSLLVTIERGNIMIEETLKAKDAIVSLVDMQNDSLIVIRKGNQ